MMSVSLLEALFLCSNNLLDFWLFLKKKDFCQKLLLIFFIISLKWACLVPILHSTAVSFTNTCFSYVRIPCLLPFTGWTGLFCPCVLFGRNVESLREDTPWTTPCMCHAVCVEGGMALAAATAIFHGSDPRTAFLICEGLLFAWWMCGIYTGLARQSLQKKYHLKVILRFQCTQLGNLYLLWQTMQIARLA